MSRVEFRVLGSLEVVDGERRVDLGPPKQRAVFALLLLNANRVVSVDRLIDELWGEEPPPRATSSLQAYISNLRRALEPHREARERPRVLVTQPPGYLLNVDHSALDASRFQTDAAAGRALLAEGRPAEARRRLEEALSLWRGPALADFAFETFARAEAARLEELRLVAVEDRLQALIDLGSHAQAVPEAEALAAASPLRERLWELLMLALYRSGRQADALRAYQSVRRILGEELGIEPSPSLRALEADVLAQSPSIEWYPPERPRSTPSPPTAAEADRDPSPGRHAFGAVVGRDDELARLEAALDDAAAGRGEVVLVVGEPGIGKTRLAQELLARARSRGWQTAWGGSVEGGATPAFWPWVEVVRSLLDAEGPDVFTEALGPGAAELAQVVPEVKELTGGIDGSPALDPETARLRLFEAVVGLVRALARRQPLVVVLDDLQWADVASLQLLSFVGARLRDAPLAVVGTYRPAEVDHSHPLADTLAALARHQVARRVELGGLGETEVGALIAATTGAAPGAELAGMVQTRTAGNPFFVAELARLLQSQKELRAEALATAVPAGVRDVVRRRIARLPEQTTALLSLAALAGREFEVEVLEVAAQLDAERALDLVEAAVVSGLVAEDAEAVGRLRFSHDLVREAIAEDLTALRRARLHARLGHALESLHGDDPRHAVQLAHHFFSALPAASAEKAIRYALRAADLEMGRLAHEQAEAQLRRALEVARRLPAGPERDRRELDVLLPLSSWLTMTRGYAAPETGEVFGLAEQLCERLGETREMVRVLYGLMAFHLVGARYESCRQFADRLLQVATRSGDPAELVAAYQAVGLVALQTGDPTTGQRLLEEALTLDQGLHDPWLVAWFPIHPMVAVPVFLAWAVWLLGDRGRAWKLVEEARQFSSRHASDLSMAHALHFCAWLAVLDGDTASARQRTEEVVELSGQKGFPLYVAISAVLGGWARAQQGEAEEGITEIERGLAAMEATGAWMVHSFYLGLLADAQRRAGRPKEALGSVEHALTYVERAGERFHEAELHRLRGELLLETTNDRGAEAMEELEKALAVAREQGAEPFEDRARESLRRASEDSARPA